MTNGHDGDHELQALQRELDDAFATTRPRRGFEDELWTRMQSSRPPARRLRDAFAGFMRAVRAAPAVPAAAVAVLLVLVLGVGLIAYSGAGRGGGAGSAAQSYSGAGANGDASSGGFGRLPSPDFAGGGKSAEPPRATVGAEAGGAVRYAWAGATDIAIASAPVFRYHEPGPAEADAFASALGAVPRGRPAGLLGAYSASDYSLNIRGTLAAPASAPTYFVIASPLMPSIDAAGAGPAGVATIFLAAHDLVPDWPYTVSVDARSSPARVRLERQFPVAGYGGATLVDPTGQAYGIEVDVQGQRPILVAGMLPVVMDQASYRIVPPAAAVQSLPPATPGVAGGPTTVQLTRVDLVYVLVPAGDHGYYEPAYLFSGSVTVNGTAVAQRVLAAAVDPSQRTR